MRRHSLLVLVVAASALGSPAVSAGNIDYSCSIRNSARVDLTRLDGGPPLLIRQDDLMHFFPDRPRRMGVSGSVIVACDRSPEGLGCTLRDETPVDMAFGARGLMLTRLFPRSLSTAVIRVDFTILSPDSCSDPLSKVPIRLR
jgi:hypothetical protein